MRISYLILTVLLAISTLDITVFIVLFLLYIFLIRKSKSRSYYVFYLWYLLAISILELFGLNYFRMDQFNYAYAIDKYDGRLLSEMLYEIDGSLYVWLLGNLRIF